jgi:uncharacterized membrane protein
LFILLANQVSDNFALRYALLIIGVVQLLSIWMAQRVLKGCAAMAQAEAGQPSGKPMPLLAAE